MNRIRNGELRSVVCRCGHTEQVMMERAPEGKRSLETARSGRRLCKNCYRESQLSDSISAQIMNEAAGLPELDGTPKQIAWAETIRTQVMARMRHMISNGEPVAPPNFPLEDLEYCEWIGGQVDAAWWIENRKRLMAPKSSKAAADAGH